MKIKPRVNQRDKKKSGIGIGEFFLDSGAFGLSARFGKLGSGSGDFYESKEFKKYIRKYAQFVADYEYALDYFVTVDVIGDPERSLRSSAFLEKCLSELGVKKKPVPVVHYGTDPKYLWKYIDKGHDFLGLGGLGRKMTQKAYKAWLDSMFTAMCPRSNGNRPIVRLHGFAVTSWRLLTRYPWWSVDSTTYNKMAGYGWLLVPQWNDGKWDFSKPYHQIGVCDAPSPKTIKKYGGQYAHGHFSKLDTKHQPVFVSPTLADGKKHLASDRILKKIVERWLEFIGIPFGDENTEGVSNKFALRSTANILYFDMLQQALPRWPGKFIPPRGPSLLDLARDDGGMEAEVEAEEEPRLFITGGGPDKNCVEGVLDRPQVMMSFFDMQGTINGRFLRHAKQRRQPKQRKKNAHQK